MSKARKQNSRGVASRKDDDDDGPSVAKISRTVTKRKRRLSSFSPKTFKISSNFFVVVTVALELPVLSKQSGNLLACGQGDLGQLGLGEDITERTKPALHKNLKNIVDIRAGGVHSLCLTSDGKIYSFGCNDEGVLGRDSTDTEFEPLPVELPGKCIKITAGDSHSACLLDDGRVFAWGSFRVSS